MLKELLDSAQSLLKPMMKHIVWNIWFGNVYDTKNICQDMAWELSMFEK